MARGYWLKRGQAIYATRKSAYVFDKWSFDLPRRGSNSYNREFFIPQFECTDDFRQKNIPVEEDIDSDTLDQIVQNVDFNNSTDQQTDQLNKALKKARLQKTQADTKLVGQKLEQRKKQLFYQWSEKFFNNFTEHFGKLKNVIIQLHLNQQQINKFSQTLDICLKNMQLDLNTIWDQFQQEKEQQSE